MKLPRKSPRLSHLDRLCGSVRSSTELLQGAVLGKETASQNMWPFSRGFKGFHGFGQSFQCFSLVWVNNDSSFLLVFVGFSFRWFSVVFIGVHSTCVHWCSLVNHAASDFEASPARFTINDQTDWLTIMMISSSCLTADRWVLDHVASLCVPPHLEQKQDQLRQVLWG